MALGTSVTLSATGIYSDRTTEDISDAATWTIEDEAVLMYDDTGSYGKIDAVGLGSSRVSVSVGDVSASLILTVSDATLVSLTVLPPKITLPQGGEIPLEVTGFFTDETCQDITGDIVWTIGNPGMLTIDNGILVALAQGQTTLTASFGGVQYTVPITINDADLVSIELSPAVIRLASGLSMDVHVTGIYSDNSKRDLTGLISWESTNDTIASVSVSGDQTVLAGRVSGAVTLTAWLGSLHASSPVTVTQAELSRIEISAGDGDIPKGLTRQIRATGIYTDNTAKDITAMVLWESSDEDVAVISNASGSKGLLTALDMGSARVGAHAGGISATEGVTVGSAVLQKLDVSAGFRSLPAGLSRGLKAQGLYSDQTIRDVTKDAIWASSNTQVAVVGNGDNKGVVTGIVPGGITISARVGGMTSALPLSITDAIIVSLEISPGSATVAAGLTQSFTATGLYSDNTLSDVTGEALWGSQNRDVAVPDNSEAFSGTYQTLVKGDGAITAVLGGVAASAQIHVGDAVLDNIFPSESIVSLERGMSKTIKITGRYTDSTTKDISGLALWESDNPDIARVENNPVGKGTVYAVAQGSTTIHAKVDDFDVSCGITVKAAGINHIIIVTETDIVAAGTSAQLSVTGYFNDGSERDLTESVLWESSDTGVADVSNAEDEHGLLRAYTPGTVTVTASYLGQSGNVTMDVSAATLESIEVLPADDSLPSGFSSQYQAIGHFSDASVQDLTQRAVWQVDDNGLAIISNLVGLKGRLYSLAPGTVHVSARFGGITGETTLTITGDTLVAFRLRPSPSVIEQGKTASIVLEGLFSDDSVRDLSSDALWLTTNVTVMTVSNGSGSEGLMTGRSAGEAAVLAIYSNRGFIAPVYVIDELFIDIEQVTDGLQCTAYGAVGADQYLDVTAWVTWSSSDETVLQASTEEGEQGFFLALQPGTATITAAFSETLSVSRGVVLNPAE